LYGVFGALKGLARAGLKAIGGAFVDKEATSLGTSAARGAYETALAGGRHSGLLRNYAGRSVGEITRAVRRYERQAALHLEKIANPARFAKDWANLTAREQQGLLRKWAHDAARNAEEADVLRGLLR
jgi:acyl-CoA reductase-like NAD-dependent aldehyde dehydrogenase